MKIIVEQNDLIEGNFNEELLDDVARMLYPLNVEFVYLEDLQK
mgnify:CR=1 FL=1